MSDIWFTADTHFGHAKICLYAERPFTTVEEMDATLLENINRLVKPKDTLYHLGDFSFGREQIYRKAIRCRNLHLVLGNHDREIRRDGAFQALFSSVSHLLEMKYNKQSITLCHYAMKVWNKSHRGAWHLHGHSHGSLPDDPNSLSLDVGVDCCEYYPVSFDEVGEAMSRKTFVPVDRHVPKEKGRQEV